MALIDSRWLRADRWLGWLVACLILASLIGARSDGGEPNLDPASVETILHASRIWTGDRTSPWAESVAIAEGRIVAVGSHSEIEALRGRETVVINRPNSFVTPGLVDAHAHLYSLGALAEEVDVRGATSPDQVVAAVTRRAEEQPEGWISGRNWDQSLWEGRQFPTAAMLDARVADRPVWLRRVDGHAAWGNSEALRLAGITAETDDPQGGRIIRDEDGNPTGVLIDSAMDLVGRVIPAPDPDAMRRRLLKAQDEAIANGLTGIHYASMSPAMIEGVRQLDSEGELKLRIYGMASPGDDPVAYVSQPPKPVRPGSRFELRAIKIYIDGAMGSRGALLFEPYADDPSTQGLQLIPTELYQETVTAAVRHGWQVCTHAIGDRGNAIVVETYLRGIQAVPGATDTRLRSEHAQMVRYEDVQRFAEGGIIASVQPSHASTDKRWADQRLGADSSRVAGAYAWRWFADAGVVMAMGSDFPVEPPSPFWGLYAATTRQDRDGEPAGGWHPEHLLTLDEALSGFTRGAAYAGFAEDRLGQVAPGYLADLTVIDRDLFLATPQELLDAQVEMTIIEGEVVFTPERSQPMPSDLGKTASPMEKRLVGNPRTDWSVEEALAEIEPLIVLDRLRNGAPRDRIARAQSWLEKIERTRIDLGVESYVIAFPTYLLQRRNEGITKLGDYVVEFGTFPPSAKKYTGWIGRLLPMAIRTRIDLGQVDEALIQLEALAKFGGNPYGTYSGFAQPLVGSEDPRDRELLVKLIGLAMNDASLTIEERFQVLTYCFGDRAAGLRGRMGETIGGTIPFVPFKGPKLGGGTVGVEDFRGQVVLIDFWATWCGPCLAEMPNVVKAYQEYGDRGFAVLGVSLDDPEMEQRIRATMERFEMTWPQLYDGKGFNAGPAVLNRVQAIPQTYLLDRQGRPRYAGLRGEQIAERVAELLAEPDPEQTDSPQPRRPVQRDRANLPISPGTRGQTGGRSSNQGRCPNHLR